MKKGAWLMRAGAIKLWNEFWEEIVKKKWLALLMFAISNMQADDSSFRFEGILGNPSSNIRNMNANAASFIPWNPIVVEIGAYEGEGTFSLAHAYPYGRVFAFEPHPEAYARLAKKVEALNNVVIFNTAISGRNGELKLYENGPTASALKNRKRVDNANGVMVPTVRLEDWCARQGIDHIDFLRLDAGGLEREILRSSSKILSRVIVLVVKTYMQPSDSRIFSYSQLKKYLKDQGFELLSHWYQEGCEGEATFIQKYMYDALFR